MKGQHIEVSTWIYHSIESSMDKNMQNNAYCIIQFMRSPKTGLSKLNCLEIHT